MDIEIETTTKNSVTWRLNALWHELRKLEREERHLRTKMLERQLSTWELSRLYNMLHEYHTLYREAREIL